MNPQISDRKARKCIINRDYSAAAERFRDLISLNGETRDSLFWLAKCYYKLDRLPDAATDAERALKFDMKSFECMKLLANIHYKLTQYEICYDYTVKALSTGPAKRPAPSSLMLITVMVMKCIPGQKEKADKLHQYLLDPGRADRKWMDWAREFCRVYESEYKPKSNA